MPTVSAERQPEIASTLRARSRPRGGPARIAADTGRASAIGNTLDGSAEASPVTGSARRASAAASAVTGDVPDAVGTSSDSSGAALSPKRMHRPRPGPRGGRHPRIAILPGSPQTRPLPYMARPRSHRLVGARVSRERVRVAPSSIRGMALRLSTAAAGVRISRVSPRTACSGVRAHRERLRIARTGSAQRAHAFASHSRVFAPDPPDSAAAPPSSASSSSPSAPAAQELAHSSPLSPSDRSAVGLGRSDRHSHYQSRYCARPPSGR